MTNDFADVQDTLMMCLYIINVCCIKQLVDLFGPTDENPKDWSRRNVQVMELILPYTYEYINLGRYKRLNMEQGRKTVYFMYITSLLLFPRARTVASLEDSSELTSCRASLKNLKLFHL